MAKLTATKRSETGTRKVRALRSKGLIPGIIYGHGRKPLPVTLSEHDVEVALLHGERVLEIKVGNRTQNVLVKDVQWDTFGQEVLHVDLTWVDLDERVEVKVPLVLRGTPAGADEGGVLSQNLDEVALECMVRALPDDIRVPVTDMQVGARLFLRDVKLPEGTRLIGDPDTLVCSVTVLAEEEVPEAAEAPAAEPEIIGEKPEEEQKQEGES
jgi:large subunit ribosomal protein L25